MTSIGIQLQPEVANSGQNNGIKCTYRHLQELNMKHKWRGVRTYLKIVGNLTDILYVYHNV